MSAMEGESPVEQVLDSAKARGAITAPFDEGAVDRGGGGSPHRIVPGEADSIRPLARLSQAAQVARASRRDPVPVGSDIRDDREDAAAHGLEERTWGPVRPCRRDIDVGPVQKVAHLRRLNVSEEAHPMGQPQILSEPLGGLQRRSRSRKATLERKTSLLQDRKGSHDRVVVVKGIMLSRA